MSFDPSRRGFLALPAAAPVLAGAPRTAELQQLIDTAADKGGGTVLIPPGRHVTGTLRLRSNVRLWIEPGAILEGSRSLADYTVLPGPVRGYTDNYTDKSLIHAEDAENISIEGRGTIDGQGAAFKGPYKARPYMIRMIRCRNVAVSGVTIRDSPMWVQHYLACDGVAIHGITVHSRVNHNNDGIDIDSCRRVRISDCDISSGDDAIVLKSTTLEPCRDVAVVNCTLSTACNAFKLGTESNGGFEEIVMSNCTIYDTRLAGIALEIVDGGVMDGVTIANVSMRNVGAPLFARLGDRARPSVPGGPKQPVGRLRNVTLSGIRARACGPVGCAFAGLPGHPLENISLSDIRLEFVGGGTEEDARRAIPEKRDAYPEFQMFGKLSAFGLFLRHARNVRLRDIELVTEKPDARPPIVSVDVDGLDIDGSPAVRHQLN